MMSLPRQQRAERVQALLAEKNLTRHGAHLRIGISRGAMDKLWEGLDVDLETVEGLARGLRLDVNEWRDMWGYDPITPSTEAAIETLARRGQEVEEDVDVLQFTGGQDIPPEDAEIINNMIRAFLAERRKGG